MSRLRLYFLGPPRIEKDSIAVEISRRKAIALVAYLAVSGSSHSRDVLATLLWPEYDQTRARAALRRDLSLLNKAFSKGWFEAEREKIGLKGRQGLWLDVDQFRKYLSEWRTHGHGMGEICPECLKPLTEAVGLYRGDFLSGFSLKDSLNFDDWQFFQTEDLRAQVIGVLERLVQWHSDKGESNTAIGHARRWVEIDRANEEAHRYLIELYTETGRHAAALRQYKECVKTLERELGQPPQKETVLLFESIKKKGEKDTISSPKAMDTSSKTNLPRQLTSFIGREHEIAEIKRLLSTALLLTLTGSGGCGKTRLALEVVEGLVEEYEDGIWLVELASLTDPNHLPQEVAGALKVQEQPGRPLTDTLADFLRSKRILLVLDNCEHLIQTCATVVETLLRSCPNLEILATSREGLGISGELTYHIPSLSLPDPKSFKSMEASEMMQYEAVCLFVERAIFSQPAFEITDRNSLTVAQICRRLDGIPLAIELAAARVKMLEVEEITTRLNDRFQLLTGGSRTSLPRQQTLRATIDWSYNLLNEVERILFNRLSVFMGGWTLEAVEQICSGGGIEEYDILDLLTNLVDKSLVVTEGQGRKKRYGLLETVRQYAREKLLESGEGEGLRDRHLDWFLGFAERAETELSDAEQVLWFDLVETELDNIRAALEWSRGGGKTEMVLRLAGALGGFWKGHGYYNEGREWLEEALAKGSGVSDPVRAKALYGAASMAWSQSDWERATELSEESLILCREMGDKKGITVSLHILGVVAWEKGNRERAVELIEESSALRREIGDKRSIASSLIVLGRLAGLQGNYKRATILCEESLNLSRELGNNGGIGASLFNLGLVALSKKDYRRAAPLFEKSIALFQEIGNKGYIANLLQRFGYLAVAGEQFERGARLFGAVEILRESISFPVFSFEQEDYDRSVAAARAQLAEDAFAAAWAEGRAMSMEEAVEFALSMGSEPSK